METLWLLVGRYVDPVFQHSKRHFVGFVRHLVKSGSVGVVEGAVERSIFRCQEGWSSCGSILIMSKFRVRRRTLRTVLRVRPISRTRFIGSGFLDGCKRFFFFFLQCPLFSHPKLVTQENDRTKTFLSRFFDRSCPHNSCNGLFFVQCFFCEDVTEHCTLAGSASFSSLFCRDHCTPLLLGIKTWHGIA